MGKSAHGCLERSVYPPSIMRAPHILGARSRGHAQVGARLIMTMLVISKAAAANAKSDGVRSRHSQTDHRPL